MTTVTGIGDNRTGIVCLAITGGNDIPTKRGNNRFRGWGADGGGMGRNLPSFMFRMETKAYRRNILLKSIEDV